MLNNRVIAARRVIGVQRAEHQVPGQRRLRGELGGFGVADFADHHDVRILPQQCRSAVAKCEPGLLVDLKLIDAGKRVFDRIFDRADIDVVVVEFLQRRRKASCFCRCRLGR